MRLSEVGCSGGWVVSVLVGLEPWPAAGRARVNRSASSPPSAPWVPRPDAAASPERARCGVHRRGGRRLLSDPAADPVCGRGLLRAGTGHAHGVCLRDAATGSAGRVGQARAGSGPASGDASSTTRGVASRRDGRPASGRAPGAAADHGAQCPAVCRHGGPAAARGAVLLLGRPGCCAPVPSDRALERQQQEHLDPQRHHDVRTADRGGRCHLESDGPRPTRGRFMAKHGSRVGAGGADHGDIRRAAIGRDHLRRPQRPGSARRTRGRVRQAVPRRPVVVDVRRLGESAFRSRPRLG